MKINDRKKVRNLILAIAIIAVLLVAGIMAYLTDTKTKTNNFEIGSVKIEFDEPHWQRALTMDEDGDGNPDGDKNKNGIPDYAENMTAGQTVIKDPMVHNVGKNEAYVYIKVKMPKARLHSTDSTTSSLFTYNYNPFYESDVTSYGTEGYNSDDWGIVDGYTVETDEYIETVYYYKNPLVTGNTRPLFTSVTMADVEDSAIAGLGIQIDAKGYGIQTNNLPEGKNTAATAYALLAEQEQGGTTITVADITAENYGQYVDIGTNILDKTIALEDGTTPQADWRVLKKDSGGTWLILADYMPNSAFDVTTVGLVKGTGNYATYGVRSTTNRKTLINGLNNSNWKNLINGSNVSGKTGVTVKGAVDLETWVASWNESGYTTLYTDTYSNKNNGAMMSDGLDGYYIGTSSNPTTYIQRVSSTAGYSNTLYFSHKTAINGCDSYRLASPSANSVSYMVFMYCKGSVSYNSYSYPTYGVRPAVYLPSDIQLDTSDSEVWSALD